MSWVLVYFGLIVLVGFFSDLEDEEGGGSMSISIADEHHLNMHQSVNP